MADFSKIILFLYFKFGHASRWGYFIITINKEYLVCIYKNKLDIIISMKTDNRIKPYNKVNYKFNSNKEIYDILNNFFENQIVYDKELYK